MPVIYRENLKWTNEEIDIAKNLLANHSSIKENVYELMKITSRTKNACRLCLRRLAKENV